MIVAISLVSLLSGAALTGMADRYPAYVAVVERGAGGLMILGLALLGSSLPFVP